MTFTWNLRDNIAKSVYDHKENWERGPAILFRSFSTVSLGAIIAILSVSCSNPKQEPTPVEPPGNPATTENQATPETNEVAIDTSKTSPAEGVTRSENEVRAEARLRCEQDMAKLEGRDDEEIRKVCAKVAVFEGCRSVNGAPIYHYDSLSSNERSKRILVFALIHGDEGPSGSVARLWMERLNKIEPRNNWRVVPVLNPDGWEAKTRMNANKIDLNRNFPTKNWETESVARWKQKKHDPRRFPGKVAGSEPETNCALAHIDDFQPGFIISIHTPYGILDFDGPPMHFPSFEPLRWFSLGNYPGSMGRYMWAERRVPVLTIELKGNENIASKLEQFDHLQDISGTVAIQSERILKREEEEKKSPQSRERPKKQAKAATSPESKARRINSLASQKPKSNPL